ncbi:MAG: N-acetylneuraminate synthase [Pseudomonadales bacterium]|nr:N-acetylneuraminate synthase [Pseudomonadales bacterium]
MRSNVLVIAEAGVNHNGSVAVAKQLVDVAVKAGADIVKFQTFKSSAVISTYAPKAEYQKASTGADESQLEMVQKLELSESEHIALFNYCVECGIQYLSTAFDLESLRQVYKLGVKIIKIPSGEITNYPLLKAISELPVDVIMSTGMSTFDEISQALTVLNSVNRIKSISLLHCNTQYPTPFIDVNLNVLDSMKNQFCDCDVGYSDHTLGIVVPIAAVAKGASIIEKHFTLDRSMEGPDHGASLEPGELKTMIESIRVAEQILGSNKKEVTPSEKENLCVARKFVVAARGIKIGEIFTEENVTTKRIGKLGVNPMMWTQLMESQAGREYHEDEPIDESDLS